MSSTHSSIDTSFAEHNYIHRKRSAKRFLMLDSDLATNPEIGPVAAHIYAFLLNQYTILTIDPNSNFYKEIASNDGWFYVYQSKIAEGTGWKKQTVGDNVKKLVEKGLLLERKNSKNGTSISFYKFTDFEPTSLQVVPVSPNREPVSPNREPVSSGTTPYNNNNINNTNLDPLSGSATKGGTDTLEEFRVLKPKLSKNVTERHFQFTKLIDSKMRKNTTRSFNKAAVLSRLEKGAVTISQIIRIDKIPFQELKKALLWAVTDNFWKVNALSVEALRKQRNGVMKIEHIINAYRESIQKSKPKEEQISVQIEEVVTNTSPDTYTDQDIEQSIKDIYWFQDELENINTERSGDNKFYWHTTHKLVKIAQWLVELENDSDYSFKAIMENYLEYLRWVLKKGKVRTLSPWMFTSTSTFFIEFINHRYRETREKIVHWQRGDYE